MPADDEDYVFDEESGEWMPASELAAKRAAADTVEVRDAVGNLLADGDQVTLIKDLTVKGAGQTLKRGTLIKSIRLTGDAQGIWVLQCGDPTGTGSGAGPGYHFGVENVPANDVYPRGTVALARQSGDPNSNRDQFFIVYKDTTLPKSTDGNGYTIFGTVTAGMDIVDKIAAAGINPNDQSSPLAPISILSVDVQPKA